jgi:hypothetical protein
VAETVDLLMGVGGRLGENYKDMDKTKPCDILSERFQISVESAKYFLGRVQKTFKTEKPSQQLILEFMQGQSFRFLPKPHQVATMMYAGGIWVHPMKGEPPTPADEEDVYF